MIIATTLDYIVCWDDLGFTVKFRGEPVLSQLKPALCIAGVTYTAADYTLQCGQHTHCCLNAYGITQRRLTLEFVADSLPRMTVTADLECNLVRFCAKSEDGTAVTWDGISCWGNAPETDTFAVSPQQQAPFLRSAFGPASDRNNTALLDRQTGKLLDFGDMYGVDICFDYGIHNYRITSRSDMLQVGVVDDHYQKQYGVTYKPINKDSVVPGPNAGFGTYYPWLFQFSEADLWEEIDTLKAQLGDFEANSVVIDIEWVRNNTWGSKDFAGDHFTPDLQRYPSGMQAVAQKIKDAGFVPHLWCGVTCEPRMNEEMLAHPEIVLADDESSWCGRYFLDLTHPYVLDHYLPRFYQQVLDWGFEAIKWDLLCETYDILEAHHHKLYDPSQSSAAIIRNMLKRAREFFGDRRYLCHCAAPGQDELRMGADIMDCCRIGRDQWSWNNFRYQMLDKLCSHYPLHNVMLYCDPDHTIIADKRVTAADTCLFDSKIRTETVTTTDEAISRLTPIVLLGQCLNIGDDLRTLSAERLDMMRRSFPVADVHPQTIGYTQTQDVVPILVQVCRPFATWSVFALVNTTEAPILRSFNLQSDLGLDDGTYFLFDYWQEKLLGQYDAAFDVELRPHQSVNYSIHRRSGVPQLLSSSRHMLQGAVEIDGCKWDVDTCTLTLSVQCVRDYAYRISLFVPDCYECTDSSLVTTQACAEIGGRVCIFTTASDETAVKTRKFSFTKKQSVSSSF